MATLKPSLSHLLAQAAPIPGPNPKTTQTFWVILRQKDFKQANKFLVKVGWNWILNRAVFKQGVHVSSCKLNCNHVLWFCIWPQNEHYTLSCHPVPIIKIHLWLFWKFAVYVPKSNKTTNCLGCATYIYFKLVETHEFLTFLNIWHTLTTYYYY